MSRGIAFSLLLFLTYIQSFASGFELKKLLKNENQSLNNDVLNIEQHDKAILSRGESSGAEDDSDEVQKDFEIMGDVINEWVKDGIKAGDVDEEYEEMLEEVKVEGYKFYHNRGCFEHDEIFSGQFDESDIDECKNICDEDATCISFEYWGQGNPNEYKGEGLCHVSSTCTSKMSKPKSVNNMTCNLYVKGEKDNWDEIEDDDEKTGETVVGIGNEEKDEHEIDEYGHVLESGNTEENENSDNLAKEINNEIATSNESESSNTVTGTCKDGKKNQDEVGIDCGGSCPKLCGADFSNPADANWADAQKNLP